MGLGAGSHRGAAAVPGPRDQRDVAGRHDLTKAEINALYFATHAMGRRRGWDAPLPSGRYWRAALVVCFNYEVDTGTVWESTPAHEPILWRPGSWERSSPDREVKERPPWGWLFYRRVKTGKAFQRPMSRVISAHLRGSMPAEPRPYAPDFLGGGARPNARFQALCSLAGIKPRLDIQTGREEPWELKDLRKTCAAYHSKLRRGGHGPSECAFRPGRVRAGRLSEACTRDPTSWPYPRACKRPRHDRDSRAQSLLRWPPRVGDLVCAGCGRTRG